METAEGRWRGARGLLFAAILLSILFWLFEAVLHVLVFRDSGLLEQIFSPPSHEVWMRLVVAFMFMTFALYAHRVVAARQRAERAADQARAEVSQIFDTAADGMRVVDRDFNITCANTTFAELVGLPKDEIIGKKCYEVFRGRLCDTPECPLERVLQGETVVTYDAWKERFDGTRVPCMVTAKPFRWPSGEILGIVEDFRDISDRIRYEAKLKESRERLRQLTSHLQGVREEERSRVAREIHDELGQALTALHLDLHWLKKRLPTEKKELAAKAEAMTRLIGATVQSVRRLCAELRPGILDDFGLAAAVEWQVGEFAKRTGHRLRGQRQPLGDRGRRAPVGGDVPDPAGGPDQRRATRSGPQGCRRSEGDIHRSHAARSRQRRGDRHHARRGQEHLRSDGHSRTGACLRRYAAGRAVRHGRDLSGGPDHGPAQRGLR